MEINRWDFQLTSIMTPYLGFPLASLDNDVEGLMVSILFVVISIKESSFDPFFSGDPSV